MTRKGPTRDRTKVLAAELTRAMQELLARGLSDPRISGLLTVTGVELSGDLKIATVLVSVLPAKNEPKVHAGLTHAALHIRHQLGDMLDSDHIPKIEFRIDQGPKQQAKVIEALGKAAREREERAAAGLDAGEKPANNEPGPA